MKRLAVFSVMVSCFIGTAGAQIVENRLTLDVTAPRARINKNIYGHFSEHLGSCIYGGFWVGEKSAIANTHGIRNDVVEALKRINIPVLRWPGGCFADEYHWRDGIGPRDQRPTMINTNWGGVTEDNSFGTHEFLELCRQLGCEPYFCGNVGSGTVQELSQWIEYVNSDNISPMTELRRKNGREKSWGVKYWGIGNENWGCGGDMRPEFYADQVRRYGNFCRDYGNNKVFKIASGNSGDVYHWTEVLMREARNAFAGLSLHHYALSTSGKSATQFDESGWFETMKNTLKLDTYITKHCAIMDRYDPGKRVALIIDEYGTWFAVEPGTNPGFLYQQNTMRDALAAGCNLNIFNNHSDRVRMANIAQIINVLQSMILTRGDSMLVTPTYHVFEMFKVHQEALSIPATVQSNGYVLGNDRLPSVNCSASVDAKGKVHLSLCNINPRLRQNVVAQLKGFQTERITGRILTADQMDAHNTFSRPDAVMPRTLTDFRTTAEGISVSLPPMSVVVLELEGKLDLPASAQPERPIPGLTYQYYEGQWDKFPDFASIAAKRSGKIENFAFPQERTGDNFALQYDGYLQAPVDGPYTLSLTADDGARLYLDGKELIVNDDQPSGSEVSGSVLIRSGYHKIQVKYFQRSWGSALRVDIEGPGLAKQEIPASMLFRRGE